MGDAYSENARWCEEHDAAEAKRRKRYKTRTVNRLDPVCINGRIVSASAGCTIRVWDQDITIEEASAQAVRESREMRRAKRARRRPAKELDDGGGMGND